MTQATIQVTVGGVIMPLTAFDEDQVFTSLAPISVTVPFNHQGRAGFRRLWRWASKTGRPSRGWRRHIRQQKAKRP